ncbi:hypothetical protein O9649_28230 [Achromobacter dolens]|uniref:hypothetical protein n=1 Tax=Achromobacter dolens TaxID=1287738 RepID=UPI0022B8F452|nr:hypothetical protein [Achromobacter dolens]MCZ8411685.1 hypothetical protein [Achromobacter dolens]
MTDRDIKSIEANEEFVRREVEVVVAAAARLVRAGTKRAEAINTVVEKLEAERRAEDDITGTAPLLPENQVPVVDTEGTPRQDDTIAAKLRPAVTQAVRAFHNIPEPD